MQPDEPVRREQTGVFRKDGEFWTVGFAERLVHLKDSKGLAYIVTLLRNPNTEFHVLDLIAAGTSGIQASTPEADEFARAAIGRIDDDQSPGVHQGLGDAGELLDDKTKVAYRKRLTELREDLDEAKRLGDLERAAAAEGEIDALTRELSRAIGWGGRARRAASATERARVSVTKAIKYTIDKVDQNDPSLARLLLRTINTGTFCAYNPGTLEPVQWDFGTPDGPVTDHRAAVARIESPDVDPQAGGVWEPATSVIPSNHVPPVIALGKRTEFVGRQAEREQIAAAFETAQSGGGSVILIGGGAGVGKTRLAVECAREVAAKGAMVLFGRCYDTPEPHPYIPFVEMIEMALAQAQSREAFRQALGDNAPELAQLVPRLRRIFPDIPAPLELPPQQARRYLFDSLHEFMTRGARARPAFLIIDDLHWADESTLSLLVHLARRIAQVPAIIVGTFRDTGAELGAALAKSVEDLIREGVRPLHLQGLPRPAVAAMIGALCGNEPPGELVESLYYETEGNPFFVEELLKHLIEEDRLFDASGHFRTNLRPGDFAVPQSVGLVVGRRLDRLTQATRDVLASAAAIGRRFEFQLLEAVADGDGAATLGAIDEALKAGLILSSSSRDNLLTFAHEIVRQTILSQVSPPRRQRLHLRVAQAIERNSADSLDERAAEIADHLLRAGPDANPVELVHYLTLAGGHAMHASAYEDALHHFEAALEHQPSTDPAGRAELLSELGMTKRSLDRWEEALAHWRESLKFYTAAGDLAAVGRLSFAIVEALSWAGRHMDAAQMAYSALALLKDGVSADRARLFGAVGMINSAAGVYQAAYDALAEAVHYAEELHDDKVLGAVLSYRAFHHFVFLRRDEAIADGMRSAELLRSGAALWSLAQLLGFLQTAMFESGQIEASRAVAEELEPLAARLNHSAARMLGVRISAWCDFCKKPDLDALERAFARDLEITQSAKLPWIATSHAQLGLVDFLRGNWDAARIRCEQACAAEFPNAFDGFGAGVLFRQLAYMGDKSRALKLLEDKKARLPRLGSPNPMGAWALLLLVVEGLFVLGERARAAELYPLALQAANTGARCLTVISRSPHTMAGTAASCERQWGRAEGHFIQAIAQSDAMPHPLERAEARRFYGQMLIERGNAGDRSKARAILSQALQDYRLIGMPKHTAIVTALLEQVGE